MSKYKLIVICGKSAAGKDTFLQGMLKTIGENANEIISYTTRPPREGEVDGKNYHFITEEEFLRKIWYKEMLETAKYRDWWYGTAFDSLKKDKINIGVFNRKGVESLLQNSKDIDIFIVQIMASNKTRLLRALHREEHPDVDEIVRRYEADKIEWENFDQTDLYINNDYDDVASHIMTATVARILEEAGKLWAELANK